MLAQNRTVLGILLRDPPDQPGFGGFEEARPGVDISALRHRPVIKITTPINRDLKYTRICSDPDFGISVQK